MFKAAHKLAKTFVGNYRACFVMALAEIRNTPAVVLVETFENISDVKIWERGTLKRVYFTSNIPNTGGGQYYYDTVTGTIHHNRLKGVCSNFIGQHNINLLIKFADALVRQAHAIMPVVG